MLSGAPGGFARAPIARALPLALALAAFGAGLFLAWHHPWSPAAATVGFVGWTALALRCRSLWLLIVPAVLPVLDFSPWTGWIAFGEFDLLMLGTIAAVWATTFRNAAESTSASTPIASPRFVVPIDAGPAAALAAVTLLALWRGVDDVGGWSVEWFGSYADPVNSVRVARSALYALALAPALYDAFGRTPEAAAKRVGRGMQIGLALVGVAVLWERAAYPGLLDFSRPFRATALFWEMHVGGAAIDAYLALATPFAFWALQAARSRLGWAASALVAILAVHACLVTFSRGAYAGVALPLAGLGLRWAWLASVRRRAHPTTARTTPVGHALAVVAAVVVPPLAFAVLDYSGAALVLLASVGLLLLGMRSASARWRRTASIALALALVTEVVAVVLGGSFMRTRLETSERNFGSRLAHWRHGLELPSGTMEWLAGVGLGRLPGRYASSIPGEEFPGAAAVATDERGRAAVRLSGPPTQASLGGLFALTQRVALQGGGAYRLSLDVRADAPTDIAVDLCEQHLLYALECQGRFVRLRADVGRWQRHDVLLDGPDLSPGPSYAPRLGVLSLAVTEAGASVLIARASLLAPGDGRELLTNQDFSRGLAHWWPIAQHYFLPWHIDNLWLELLIEQGIVGLTVVGLLVTVTLARLFAARNTPFDIAPFLAASTFGLLFVGCVSSVVDVPRVAFVWFLLLFTALALTARR